MTKSRKIVMLVVDYKTMVRMRVLIFYNTAWYIYIFRRNLIRSLQEAGCTVYALAPEDDYSDRLRELGVNFVPLRMKPRSTNPFGEFVTFADAARALRRIRPDFVLSYTIKCNLYAGLCNYVTPYKQIANISGLGEVFDRRGVLNSTVRSLYRVALRRASAVLFQNRDDLDLCVREKLVPRSVSKLIPGSGVDLQKFQPLTRSATSGENGKRVFLMFGRLLPRKGYGALLDVAASIRARYGERAEFWILGKPDREREESMKLYERIRAAHEQGLVKYHEPTDNVLPILHGADVVMLPSTYNEGIPRSLLEALACGKPVITTDWKGCRETVVDGVNGRLVPPDDVKALETAVEELVLAADVKLAELGRQSRRLAETRFDESIVITTYLRELGLDSIFAAPDRAVGAE